MNKAFLEDLEKGLGTDVLPQAIEAPMTTAFKVLLYIAQKLWSIEQLLLFSKGGR